MVKKLMVFMAVSTCFADILTDSLISGAGSLASQLATSSANEAIALAKNKSQCLDYCKPKTLVRALKVSGSRAQALLPNSCKMACDNKCFMTQINSSFSTKIAANNCEDSLRETFNLDD